jgi:hypothetical protein
MPTYPKEFMQDEPVLPARARDTCIFIETVYVPEKPVPNPDRMLKKGLFVPYSIPPFMTG